MHLKRKKQKRTNHGQGTLPWQKRIYGINPNSSRRKELRDKGIKGGIQYIVTMPPEVADLFHREQGFNWEVRDGCPTLVPCEGARKRKRNTTWSDWEIQIALDPKLSLEEAARKTGRTMAAVSAKRWEVKKLAGSDDRHDA